MQEIDGQKAMLAILVSGMRLTDYAYIMQNLDEVNVSNNAEFQRKYNGFYKLRRDAVWREKYYRIFESYRINRKKANFSSILECIYESTGMVEASFASKMLATLDPDKPIWDSRVVNALNYLGLRLSGSTDKKLDSAKHIYLQIEEWYSKYLVTLNAAKNIAVFDKLLPDYAWLSKTKKIDYMLWGLG